MRVAEYVAKFIADKKVDTVFSVAGGGCVFLSDAFENEERINLVANHHEQACSMAAEGYSRISENIGVCLVTSGPGGSNAWTGTLCSYQDSVPVIVISGNVNKSMTTNYTGLDLRQLGDQEFDVVKTVSNFTKYAVQINDASTIKYHLERAYYEAVNGRKGPVWIDIPLDISTDEVDIDKLEGYIPEDKIYDKIDIKKIINKLSNSKRPLIIAGNGVRLSNSVDLLDEILEEYKIPVVTSFNGNDSVSNEYKYYGGRFGTAGQISANKLIQESDFILSLGSRLYVRQIGYNFKSFAKNAYKVYIDIDKRELNKPTLFPDMKINVDVNLFLNTLKPHLKPLSINKWRDKIIKYKEKYPTVLDRHITANPFSIYSALDGINNYMNKNISVVTSGGGQNIQGMQVIKLKKHQRLFSNKATAPMGYGLPASIGAYYGSKKPVLCLEGDGSLQMNIQELQVLVQNKIPIKLVVINNDGYACIKITQTNFCNGNLSLTNPSSGLTLPNYSKISYAYGLKYHSVKNREDLKSVFDNVFINDVYEGPKLIELFVDPNEVHEPKVKAQLDENGKFIPGELDSINWISK